MTQEASQKTISLKGRKLFVAIPAYDHMVPADMVASFLDLSKRSPDFGVDFRIGFAKGCSLVTSARNILVNRFIKSDCDSLLFIDSDIMFDPEDIFRLLAWTTNKHVVGGVYSVKTLPAKYYLTLDHDNDRPIIDESGLVKAKSISTGFMMIQRRVIEDLIKAHPEWEYLDRVSNTTLFSVFDLKSTPEGYIGEDMLFCQRAREHGFEIWIDPMIKLGHFGRHEFKSDFANDVLFPMMKATEIKEENEPLRVAYG